MASKYIPTIGIECHVQLKTKTKLFSSVSNDAREAPPNTLVSPICFGLPGTLPVLNEKAIELATKAALALGTEPQKVSSFDRKHYFYPDLPKGYQITQYAQPVIAGGHVDINTNGQTKRIGITRAHLEEDAGKNMHPPGANYSLVDLNRAGTPLLEIVSEPDIHSAEEAKAYARELYLLIRYADVSDADLYHGNMRFDVNVSVSRDPKVPGIRTETKNLNSFRSVAAAVDYEIQRQIHELEAGRRIAQETRGWDEAKQKTISQRGKEEAHDYRYFPEPDIPPIEIKQDFIDNLKHQMPIMPDEWRKRLEHLGLNKGHIETLLQTNVEHEEAEYLHIVEEQATHPELAKFIMNWFVNGEIPLRGLGKVEKDIKKADRIKLYKEVHQLTQDEKLSSTNAKALLAEVLSGGKTPANVEDYASQKGLLQVSDSTELIKIIEKVIKANAKAAEDIKKGEQKAIRFLVGQVMKETRGQANPSLVQKLIKQQLFN